MNFKNIRNEQQLKRTPSSTPTTMKQQQQQHFFPISSNRQQTTTTTTKTVFTKLSSGSTSSMSSIDSIQQYIMNPFEETNRFRLEQSVLSPNLFHVANTSTPERDTNSLWNIDQRAVLYPADIPIDESSLMAQYAYDYKMSNQVIPAVEAFWTQNKIIIESPLTGTTGSALRAKLAPLYSNNNTNNNSNHKQNRFGKANSVNSPLTNELYNNFSTKKLNAIDIVVNTTGSKLNIYQQQQQQQQKSTVTTTYISKSNKRDQICQTNFSIPTDFDITKVPELKQFLLSDEQCTESPVKKELNNSIRKKLFDHNSEDGSTATTTPPTQSVLLTKLKSSDLSHLKVDLSQISQLPKPEIYSSSDDNHKQARTLASYSSSNTEDCWRDSFESDDRQFASSPKFEKYSNIIHDIGGDFGCDDELSDSVFLTQHHRTPPDLSPLLMRCEPIIDLAKQTNNINSPTDQNRLTESNEKLVASNKKVEINSPNLSPIRNESTNCTLKQSLIKSKIKNLIESEDLLVNMSSSSGAKSIIFMDIGPNLDDSKNKSFSESLSEHRNHYKREEFYKQTSFNEENHNNETYRNDENNSKQTTNNININKPIKNQISSGSTSSSSGSKPFLLTTMNSMMSETTTNTFNQDSQDTGYQTNSVVNGSNSNTTTNTNIPINPSMIMDMTNDISLYTSTKPADYSNKENYSSNKKRPSLDMKKSHSTNIKIIKKKNSISLNNLENIKPIESSTPEILKFSFNSKSSFKPIVSSSTIWQQQSDLANKKRVNFVKSKTTSFNLMPRQISAKKLVAFNNDDFGDVSMLSTTNNNSNLVFYSDSINSNKNDELFSKTKDQFDSMFVEQSIQMNKISPSDYARTVLEKAKLDLKESIKFT